MIEDVSGIHDSILSKICLGCGKNITLFFALKDKETIKMRLASVAFFYMTDVVAGNIILSMTITDSESTTEESVKRAFSIDDKGYINPEFAYRKLIDEDLKLVELHSSYGCTMSAICLDIISH